MQCRICNNSEDNQVFQVREMRVGYRDRFTYFQCSKCGCLQIAEFPSDISKYYQATYFSLSQLWLKRNPIQRIVRRLRNHYAVFGEGFVGKLIHTMRPNRVLRTLSRIDLTRNSRILDVGSGTGFHLYDLKEIGFQNLLGIEPHIEEDIEYENGLKILKNPIHDLHGEWDLIMFHHSFEHVPDPLEVLRSVSRLLSEKGVCLIRIPTVSSYAWEHYGVHWVQLDAPRHFFLHSIESIKILAEKANLSIEDILFESTALQFWGSEQYLRSIPLESERSYRVNPSNSIFSASEIKAFKQKAQQLNLEKRGDSAAFYLKKGHGSRTMWQLDKLAPKSTQTCAF